MGLSESLMAFVCWAMQAVIMAKKSMGVGGPLGDAGVLQERVIS